MDIITVTADNFKTEVLDSTQPVLIDFWASWCGPCRMMSPVVDEIADEVVGIKVGKINVDEQPGLASAYNVMSIPTLLVFKGGKVTATSVGVRPKQEIISLIGK